MGLHCRRATYTGFMKLKAWDPRRLDVSVFTASEGHAEGHFALAAMTRLADQDEPAATADAGQVRWAIDGRQRKAAGREPEIWLDVSAEARVERRCQRCLQPVALDLRVHRPIRFVRGEAEAARLDADQEDDVLALEPTLDLQMLVEDELLLALPIIPRHEDCAFPAQVEQVSTGDEAVVDDSTNPFAVLAALKNRGPQGSGTAH